MALVESNQPIRTRQSQFQPPKSDQNHGNQTSNNPQINTQRNKTHTHRHRPDNSDNHSHSNSHTDYSSMTSDEMSSESLHEIDYETEITAHLVVNSLILLGFNTDEYISIYSGIAFDITPVTTKTFDKPNEKMLSIILHYLLCILDRDEFLLSIEKCWPFLDAKEKQLFKKALHISLIRLIERGVVPNALYKGSLLTQASGREVWQLLHLLTDRAVDHMLRELREAQFPEAISADSALTSSSHHNTDSASSSSTVVTGSAGSVTREVLLTDVDEKIEIVRQLILHCHDERQAWGDYLEELEGRLAEAKRSIKQTEEKLREIHLQDEYNILGEQGRAKRMKLIARINSQKDLLASFLASPLLQDVDKYLREEEDAQAKELEARNNQPSYPAQSSNSSLNTESKLGLANAPKRRKMLSKEELEAYKISMRDAISELIAKIEEVCSLV